MSGYRLLDEAIDITDELIAELMQYGECVTFCYNGADIWAHRKDAIEFFKEASWNSEGCERERYMNILLDLMSGSCTAFDGVTEYLMQETEYHG